MDKLIFIILLAAVCSTGVLSGPITRSLSDIRRELEILKRDDISNLKGKNLMFSDFCLSLLDLANQLEKMRPSDSLPLSESDSIIMEGAFIDSIKSSDRFFSVLEDSNLPLEVKIQEASIYIISGLDSALSVVKMRFGNTTLTQEVAEIYSDVDYPFKSAHLGKSLLIKALGQVKEQFEETKAKVVAQDASMSEVEIENLDCKALKRLLNSEIVLKFQSENEDAIKIVLSKDLQTFRKSWGIKE